MTAHTPKGLSSMSELAVPRAGARVWVRPLGMSDPARVQGLVPRPCAAAAYEGLLHRLKLLIVLLLMKVLKVAAARITRQLAQ